ncbi:ANTAR domain-containing response regulator [Oryzibacter oryziterrae]|uniref:ANTAR domain-containing response regulator n=1 Tax=Oryzibacter oryziterrae TaxID=2766474 RepID=UPI001F2CE189|nr:ANTAR domain-containing protein [Oryzibacter oryziterrae]
MVNALANRPPLQLASWRAVVLHPPHAVADAVVAQLERLGLTVTCRWPDLQADDAGADVVIYDADMGHDGQFPWGPGEAPMPLIALIGSEAPGRIGWALAQGADAHLLKPIHSSGVYSALLIASHAFEAKRRAAIEILTLKDRLTKRSVVVRATLILMQAEGLDETLATKRLRTLAMESRRTIEDMAEEIVLRRGLPRSAIGRPGRSGV